MERTITQTLDPTTLAQIKRLYFQTNKLAEQGLAGGYKSAFRGKGIEFEEVRDYFPGDDIRSIDWKVTARMNKPFVKIYREERELNVVIAVDVSASTLTGTKNQIKEAQLAKLGAVLTLIAMRNNDNVGLITFSEQVESYFPPRKARGAVWRILHEVLAYQNSARAKNGICSKTSLHNACTFLRNVLKRKCIIFLLSDFLDDNYEKPLAILAKRHDLNAIVINDPIDFELPRAGLIKLLDPETREELILDSDNFHVRNEYQQIMKSIHQSRERLFAKHKIDVLNIRTNEDLIKSLQHFFKNKKA